MAGAWRYETMPDEIHAELYDPEGLYMGTLRRRSADRIVASANAGMAAVSLAAAVRAVFCDNGGRFFRFMDLVTALRPALEAWEAARAHP